MTDTETSSPTPPADHPLAHLRFSPGLTPQFSEDELQEIATAVGIPAALQSVLGSTGISPLAVKLGICFQEMTAEHMVATMPVAGNEQPVGLLHGGAHLALAETLGSVAAKIHAGKERGVVGIEIGATHHRAVKDGLVIATATALSLGQTLTSHEIVMRDEQGRRLSTVRMTNMILLPR
ncbi:MAG: hotdog fold thioesterase [Micrococcus sp.]|nr:hotdog fold thioesterase [Micrococcus sp.]